MHACLNKDACAPHHCMCAGTVARSCLCRFIDQFVWPVLCFFCSKLWAVFSFAKINFLNHLSSFSSKIFRHLATWPWDRIADHSAQWQNQELIFGTLFTTRRERRERDAYACLRPCSGNVHACVSETHVSCTFPCMKKTQTIFSWLLPLFKGYFVLYDTHTQLPYHTDKQNAVCSSYIYANSN